MQNSLRISLTNTLFKDLSDCDKLLSNVSWDVKTLKLPIDDVSFNHAVNWLCDQNKTNVSIQKIKIYFDDNKINCLNKLLDSRSDITKFTMICESNEHLVIALQTFKQCSNITYLSLHCDELICASKINSELLDFISNQKTLNALSIDQLAPLDHSINGLSDVINNKLKLLSLQGASWYSVFRCLASNKIENVLCKDSPALTGVEQEILKRKIVYFNIEDVVERIDLNQICNFSFSQHPKTNKYVCRLHI